MKFKKPILKGGQQSFKIDSFKLRLKMIYYALFKKDFHITGTLTCLSEEVVERVLANRRYKQKKK